MAILGGFGFPDDEFPGAISRWSWWVRSMERIILLSILILVDGKMDQESYAAYMKWCMNVV